MPTGPTWLGRVSRSVLASLVAAGVTLVVTAPPAAAHGTSGSDRASNYRVIVSRVPDLRGLSLRMRPGGLLVELSNTSATVVTVMDYSDRPYLRVGPNGVFENTRSIATYLNASTDGTAPIPADAGIGPPRWRRISTGTSATWHDHRLHWMAADPSPVVRSPERRHVVQKWSIPLRYDGVEHDASGRIEWVPPPSGGRWVIAMAVMAGLTATAARLLGRRGRTAIVAVCAVIWPVHLFGLWTAGLGGALDKFGLLPLPLLSIGLMIGGLVLERHEPDGTLMTLAGGGIGAVAALTDGASWLGRSELPTSIAAALARLLVVALAGAGSGLAFDTMVRLVRRRTTGAVGNRWFGFRRLTSSEEHPSPFL